VGIINNPNVKNNLERDFVIATGSDGFQATISVAEIDPSFGAHAANPIIVAFAANGQPLIGTGDTRLITPDDTGHGRWVSNLVNLEVFDVSNWKVLVGESLDMSGFSFQTLGLTLAGGTLTSSTGPATLTVPTVALTGGLIDSNITVVSTSAVTQASGTTLLSGKITAPTLSITGGSLFLTGTQAGQTATITGTTTVSAAATFGGIGNVGRTIVNGGTFAAGVPAFPNGVPALSSSALAATPGTLNVQGNLELNSAATYLVQASPGTLSGTVWRPLPRSR
jgi:hypothetical protein